MSAENADPLRLKGTRVAACWTDDEIKAAARMPIYVTLLRTRAESSMDSVTLASLEGIVAGVRAYESAILRLDVKVERGGRLALLVLLAWLSVVFAVGVALGLWVAP